MENTSSNISLHKDPSIPQWSQKSSHLMSGVFTDVFKILSFFFALCFVRMAEIVQ